MRTTRLSRPGALLVMTLLLAGCSRDQPQSRNSAPPPAAAAAPADVRKVIVAFGDSLSAGYGVEPGSSFPDFVQRMIDAKKLPYRIVNAGVSGETTTDALNRVSDVLREHPAIVIVEFGGNDGLRGLPVSTTRENLDSVVGTLTKAGVKVLIAGMTLPPNYGPDYIKPFEQTFRDLAAKYKAPLIPFLLEGVGGHRSLMQRDGIHPNVEGNRIVARTVMQALEPMLQ